MKTDIELNVSDLSYTYPTGVKALDRISFQVARGEKVVIIGPNGAGKSTLLLLLAGLLRADGISESIRRRVDPEGRGEAIAFLFQNPDDQIIATTVEDDVGFSLLQKGFDPDRVRELVELALRQVHLEGYEGRSPLEMSFGEKKRICLAGCLIGDPSMLCLDEPALGLDPRETGQLHKILKEIPRTMLLSSMDFQMISGLADRVILLNRGKVVTVGSPADILSDRELMEANGLAI
jgi:cobalt/nickel transport system ATP-binding protein